MSIKISELPSAEAVNNGDYLAIVQDGTTKKATASMLSADIATTINSSSTNNTAAGAKAVYDYAAPKKHDSTAQTYGVGTDEKYGHVMLVDDLNSSSLQAGKALSSHQGYVIKGLLDDKQDIINGYNKIDADFVDDTTSENKFITEEQIQEIEELKAENEALLDQIPTATATGETINVQDSSNLPIQEFEMLGNATQDGTPTPDTPQDIHVVTGDNTVKVAGKNLLKLDTISASNFNTTTYTSIGNIIEIRNGNNDINRTLEVGTNYIKETKTNSWDWSQHVKFKNLKPNTQYRLSCNIETNITSGTINIFGNNMQYSDKTYSVTKTTNEDGKFSSSPHLYTSVSQASGKYVYLTNIQLEEGSTKTDYEAPTITTQLLSLGSIELAKIPDTNIRDVAFKAVSSNNPLKPSYYDTLPSEVKATLTVGSWYKEQNIKQVTFVGDNTYAWAIRSDVPNLTNTTCFRCTSSADFADMIRSVPQLSPKFVCAENNNDTEHIRYTGNAGYRFHVFLDNSRLASVTVDNFKGWLVNNNLSIKYAVTPTYIELTDTTLIGQLENILQMRTIRNTTNGWIEPSGTNAQGGMVLVYRQDLATLIAG